MKNATWFCGVTAKNEKIVNYVAPNKNWRLSIKKASERFSEAFLKMLGGQNYNHFKSAMLQILKKASFSMGRIKQHHKRFLNWGLLSKRHSLFHFQIRSGSGGYADWKHYCSATSFLRNWDSILEKKRANLRSISEPARLRQPPPQKHGSGTRKRAGSKHTGGATNSRPSRAFCPLVG